MDNKLYCTNDQGEPLFYIYLIDNQEECVMTLHCSIDRNLINNKDTVRMINCIQERKVVELLRSELTQKLFKYIRNPLTRV